VIDSKNQGQFIFPKVLLVQKNIVVSEVKRQDGIKGLSGVGEGIKQDCFSNTTMAIALFY